MLLAEIEAEPIEADGADRTLPLSSNVPRLKALAAFISIYGFSEKPGSYKWTPGMISSGYKSIVCSYLNKRFDPYFSRPEPEQRDVKNQVRLGRNERVQPLPTVAVLRSGRDERALACARHTAADTSAQHTPTQCSARRTYLWTSAAVLGRRPSPPGLSLTQTQRTLCPCYVWSSTPAAQHKAQHSKDRSAQCQEADTVLFCTFPSISVHVNRTRTTSPIICPQHNADQPPQRHKL